MPRRPNLNIRVTIREKDGKTYLRFRDPITHKEQLRQVKGKYRSEWLREAGAWERELIEGDSKKKAAERAAAEAKANAITNLPWKDFRRRFEDEHLSSLAERTDSSYTSALDCIFKHFSPAPETLLDITATSISQAAASLRATGISESTTASYLRHLKGALNWAKGVKLLKEVPTFPKVKRAKKGRKMKPMKGRPPTEEEYQRILQHVGKVVHKSAVAKFTNLIEGLWWSGLRIEEAADLWWDRPDKMRVNLTGPSPVLHILAETEKGAQDRVYPVAPEFAEFLQKIPINERSGLVFKIPLPGRVNIHPNKWDSRPTVNYVSKVILKIGKSAEVIVNVSPARGPTPAKTSYAGPHSFRRAFGTRWARRVLPQILQQMMRHESIDTTMGYYVELNAESLSQDIYAAYARYVIQQKVELERQNAGKSEADAEKLRGVPRGVPEMCPTCGQEILPKMP